MQSRTRQNPVWLPDALMGLSLAFPLFTIWYTLRYNVDLPLFESHEQAAYLVVQAARSELTLTDLLLPQNGIHRTVVSNLLTVLNGQLLGWDLRAMQYVTLLVMIVAFATCLALLRTQLRGSAWLAAIPAGALLFSPGMSYIWFYEIGNSLQLPGMFRVHS